MIDIRPASLPGPTTVNVATTAPTCGSQRTTPSTARSFTHLTPAKVPPETTLALLMTLMLPVPLNGYRIHTFWSLRVVPYLTRRKASRPIRMTFGPGFP